MLASALITRSLRLINVPGRGATLSNFDQNAAFEALQDLLNSKAVSRQFVPGISRHFYSLPAQEIMSIGPGGDLDTDDFEDPVPVRVESAFIRVGGQIDNNEKVDNDKFSVSSDWTLGSGWTIQNGRAEALTASGNLSQSITGLTVGTVYNVKLDVQSVSLGTVTFSIAVISEIISGAGSLEFSFTATATSHTWTLTPVSSLTMLVNSTTVREVGVARTTFSGRGSDYPLRIFDQNTYNRQFTKGAGGRPYQLLFSRNYPMADLRFDNTPGSGEFLFIDVMVNRISITSVNDDIRMYDEAIRWVRYALAKEMAPEHGKTFRADANDNLADARSNLAAANHRTNTLRMDSALRPKRQYDINRGDP